MMFSRQIGVRGSSIIVPRRAGFCSTIDARGRRITLRIAHVAKRMSSRGPRKCGRTRLRRFLSAVASFFYFWVRLADKPPFLGLSCQSSLDSLSVKPFARRATRFYSRRIRSMIRSLDRRAMKLVLWWFARVVNHLEHPQNEQHYKQPFHRTNYIGTSIGVCYFSPSRSVHVEGRV